MTSPFQSKIIELGRQAIRTPSVAGRDSPQAILSLLANALTDLKLKAVELTDMAGKPVALVIEHNSGTAGPNITLNACVDTAPAGNPQGWSHPPFSAMMENGWLFGRGAADSKCMAALFIFLMRDFSPRRGKLRLLLDADEHSGGFAGVSAYLTRFPDIDGVLIGYPGQDSVRIGARGVLRLKIQVSGQARHSGSSHGEDCNAILRAARLVRNLAGINIPPDPDFGRSGKLTITGLRGGESDSQIPDRAEIMIDCRLTPRFDSEKACSLIHQSCLLLDDDFPGPHPCQIIMAGIDWPPYRLNEDDPIVTAMRDGACQASGQDIPTDICGPSNIGCMLARHNIPATCGFGPVFQGAHGQDEAILIDSLPTVWQAYRYALRQLLGETT